MNGSAKDIMDYLLEPELIASEQKISKQAQDFTAGVLTPLRINKSVETLKATKEYVTRIKEALITEVALEGLETPKEVKELAKICDFTLELVQQINEGV